MNESTYDPQQPRALLSKTPCKGLIQGFEVVNGNYAAYNDEWLSYYSVLFKLARSQRPELPTFFTEQSPLVLLNKIFDAKFSMKIQFSYKLTKSPLLKISDLC